MKNQKNIIICILIIGLQVDAADQNPFVVPGYQLGQIQKIDVSTVSLDNYEAMHSAKKRNYLEDAFDSVLQEEKNEILKPKKYVRFQETQADDIHEQQDFTNLNYLIDNLKILVDSEKKEEPVAELDQAMQANFALRQKAFEKKVYVLCLYKALEAYQISLEDFNKLESPVRQALLSAVAKSCSQAIYSSLYPQGITTVTVQQFNPPHFLQQTNKNIKVTQFKNHLYQKAIEKVLSENHVSIEDFNELSPFRKTTLLLKLSMQDVANLPESERELIDKLRVQRNKDNNYYKNKNKTAQALPAVSIDLTQKGLPQNQPVDIPVEA